MTETKVCPFNLFLKTNLIIVQAVIINCVVISDNKGNENSHDSKELIRDLAFKSS